ncbi:MAG: hypothetical protein JXR03_13975 [Cyclobacteriaceae bacterium]
MTLAKGFLRDGISFKPYHLIRGVLLWILFSYILYAFFYLSKESWRILTYGLGHDILLVLNDKENFVYNLFYASLATALGYQFALKFFLDNLGIWRPSKIKRSIRRTINDQRAFSWYFLAWFSRVGSVFATCLIMIPLQFDLSLIDQFSYFLILLPIVIFLSTWSTLRLMLRDKSLKWFSILTAIFILLSFSLSFHNFISTDAINHKTQQKSISYLYDLELPRISHGDVIERKSLVSNLFIVKDTSKNSSPIIFLENSGNQIQREGLSKMIVKEKAKLGEISGDQILFNLHVDKKIPLSYIEDLKLEFKKSGIRTIRFDAGAKHSKYPTNHPTFYHIGIKQYLWPRYYPQFEYFLDSLEKIDVSKLKFKLSDSYMYRVNIPRHYNRLNLTVKEGFILLNNKAISEDELQVVLYKFIKKKAPNYLILFNPDEDITYGRYIELLDIPYSVVERLRNEMSFELYNKPIESLWESDMLRPIKSRYPNSFIEWTSEEKRLMKLMEKANQKPY